MSAPIRVAVVARSVFPLHGHGGLERHVYDLVRAPGRRRARGDADHAGAAGAARRAVAPADIHPAITLITVPYRTFPVRRPPRYDRDRSQHRVSALRRARRPGRRSTSSAAAQIDIVHGLGASVLGYARQRRARPPRRW